jgi:hypothetical protein
MTLEHPTVQPSPMSLEKARTVIWPFRPYKGQAIGALLETKQITLKDLGYAVENAFDARVRQAAATLLLARLNQNLNEPSTGFVNVVSGGRSFSERRQLWYSLLQGMMMGVALALAIGVAIWGFVTQANNAGSSGAELEFTPALIVAVIIVLAVGILVFWIFSKGIDWTFKQLERRIDQHRKGQEGEERTLGVIQRVLDGKWYVFRNLSLPGRNQSDYDIILVGPAGVYTLEVKNWSGEHKNVGEQWSRQVGAAWRVINKSPSRQANDGAARLGNFFKADGIEQWVTGVVIWANPESFVMVENPSVAVWTLEHLPDELNKLSPRNNFTEATLQKIVDKLTKLANAQIAQQQADRS